MLLGAPILRGAVETAGRCKLNRSNIQDAAGAGAQTDFEHASVAMAVIGKRATAAVDTSHARKPASDHDITPVLATEAAFASERYRWRGSVEEAGIFLEGKRIERMAAEPVKVSDPQTVAIVPVTQAIIGYFVAGAQIAHVVSRHQRGC